jgi:hypothetical protein
MVNVRRESVGVGVGVVVLVGVGVLEGVAVPVGTAVFVGVGGYVVVLVGTCVLEGSVVPVVVGEGGGGAVSFLPRRKRPDTRITTSPNPMRIAHSLGGFGFLVMVPVSLSGCP